MQLRTQAMCAWTLAALLLGQMPVVHAASPAPDSVAEAARRHYQRGAELYKEGDFGPAWLEFSTAYQLSPKPGLLFNMARCEVKLGRPRDAIQHFRDYLKESPSDPDAVGIRSEIAELQAQVDREGGPEQSLVARPVQPTDGSGGRRWPVYGTVAGVGTLILGIATIATLASVGSRYGYLQNYCAPHCRDEDVSNVQNLATGGYVLLGLTLAGAATTAALLTLELRGGLRRARPMALVASPLLVVGRF